VQPNKYIGRIYGFKLFGKKGSKYEGQQLSSVINNNNNNEEEN
jgi:hypothetical protein